MNPILDQLCADHANFGKLLNVIEQQAELISAAAVPDYEVLAKAIEYLEGYPTLYHHPLENILFERLTRGSPSATEAAGAIEREHSEIQSQLARLKEVVASAERGGIVTRSSIVDAASAFVESEWAHMERERTDLFPMAAAALLDDDWSFIEGRAAPEKDTLFGGTAPAPMQRLHELLLACDTRKQTTRVLSTAAL